MHGSEVTASGRQGSEYRGSRSRGDDRERRIPISVIAELLSRTRTVATYSQQPQTGLTHISNMMTALT
jgi:hypothetical protein